MLDPLSLKYVNNTYNIKTFFGCKQFKIGEIIDFNKENAVYVQEIDFSKDSFSSSVKGFWQWEKYFRHSRVESIVFLNNSANFSYIQVNFQAHQGLKNTILKAFILPPNSSIGYLYNIPFKLGDNNIFLKIPPSSKGLITFYLFHTGELRKIPPDERLLGITVRKIKLTDVTEKNSPTLTEYTIIIIDNRSK
ncbi:MAG: hypothetical protein QXP78_05855 [Candidatus Bathyarchaeia archaeon]